MEMMVMKGEGCAHRSLESGGTSCHSGAHREAPGGGGEGRGGQREKARCGQEPLLCFPWERSGEEG